MDFAGLAGSGTFRGGEAGSHRGLYSKVVKRFIRARNTFHHARIDNSSSWIYDYFHKNIP
jgi:hypothetical protein